MDGRAACVAGAQVILYDYSSQYTEQLWKITKNSDGTFSLTPKKNLNLRLAVENGSLANNAKVKLATAANVNSQKWVFEAAPATTYTVEMDNDDSSSLVTNPAKDLSNPLPIPGYYNVSYITGSNHFRGDARRSPNTSAGYGWRWYGADYTVNGTPSTLYVYLNDNTFNAPIAYYYNRGTGYVNTEYPSKNQDNALAGWSVVGSASVPVPLKNPQYGIFIGAGATSYHPENHGKRFGAGGVKLEYKN